MANRNIYIVLQSHSCCGLYYGSLLHAFHEFTIWTMLFIIYNFHSMLQVCVLAFLEDCAKYLRFKWILLLTLWILLISLGALQYFLWISLLSNKFCGFHYFVSGFHSLGRPVLKMLWKCKQLKYIYIHI